MDVLDQARDDVPGRMISDQFMYPFVVDVRCVFFPVHVDDVGDVVVAVLAVVSVGIVGIVGIIVIVGDVGDPHLFHQFFSEFFPEFIF